MKATATADAVIVGGGIAGAAIAFYLAQAGIRPLVLESVRPGNGASSRGAGIVRSYYRLEAEARLALASIATFRNWRDEIGGDCGYRPTGFLWLVDPDGVAEAEATVALQRRLGADAELLAPADVARLQPQLAVADIGAAAYERSGGHGDPLAATRSLHAAAARQGATLREGVTVTRLVTAAGCVTGVETEAGRIDAGAVVLAAGAWSATIAATAGVTLPLAPTRMTTGTIRHGPFAAAPMGFIDTVTDTFFRPAEPGVAHVSVRDARHNTRIDPRMRWQEEKVAGTASDAAIRRLAPRIPGLDGTPLRAWVGLDGVTPDYRALYGGVPGLAGLFLCAGGNFKGFKVAPAVGRCLAALVAGTEPGIDLAPFALERFAGAAAPAEPPAYALASVA